MMKYISPGSWFSLEYPDSWREFEDTESIFLFYNPDVWTGNFRISAFRGPGSRYAKECMTSELQQTKGAKLRRVGDWECVYSAETFQENGGHYTTHLWITGKGAVSVECSFTVKAGDDFSAGENIIRSLRLRGEKEPLWKEVIPVRVLEISVINEAYEWAVSAIKKQLAKDFTAGKKDIESIQTVIDSGVFDKKQAAVWENFGIVFGTILVNEIDGMEWVTVIDGKKEFPALRYLDTDLMVYPTEIIREKLKENQPCLLKAEYDRIISAVENILK